MKSVIYPVECLNPNYPKMIYQNCSDSYPIREDHLSNYNQCYGQNVWHIPQKVRALNANFEVNNYNSEIKQHIESHQHPIFIERQCESRNFL
ncbi:hypothetical protein GJ496_000470 [Pomphorhynchus laevis]|nr:hypothetical protein GJ496_000470 [Pomphorhynchus laevis]